MCVCVCVCARLVPKSVEHVCLGQGTRTYILARPPLHLPRSLGDILCDSSFGECRRRKRCTPTPTPGKNAQSDSSHRRRAHHRGLGLDHHGAPHHLPCRAHPTHVRSPRGLFPNHPHPSLQARHLEPAPAQQLHDHHLHGRHHFGAPRREPGELSDVGGLRAHSGEVATGSADGLHGPICERVAPSRVRDAAVC